MKRQAGILRIVTLIAPVGLVSYNTFKANVHSVGFGSTPGMALLATAMVAVLSVSMIYMLMEFQGERQKNFTSGGLLPVCILATVL